MVSVDPGPMRKSFIYIAATGLGAAFLIGLLWLHPMIGKQQAARRLARERTLVARLALTDICLFTEASYLRHPNLADRFTPFQDHPMALGHFPSESLLPPPRHLVEKFHNEKTKGAMP